MTISRNWVNGKRNINNKHYLSAVPFSRSYFSMKSRHSTNSDLESFMVVSVVKFSNLNPVTSDGTKEKPTDKTS